MTKNLILEIEFHNCGELGLDGLANADQRIYDDLSLEINIVHGVHGSRKESQLLLLNEKVYRQIKGLVELVKVEDRQIHTLDGDIWSIKQYKDGQYLHTQPRAYLRHRAF